MSAIAADSPRPASRKADRLVALGRTRLPRLPADLHRAADGLDGADVDQVAVRGACSIRRNGGRPSRRSRTTSSCSLSPNSDVGREFLRFFWNSFYVSLATTILGVVVAVPAAYAFSRFRFPGRTFLFFSVLLRNMFPAVVFLMPLFLLMRWLGLVNTHGSLILTYLTFGLPLSIWLLKGFYDNIPIQLEQAARIDGATRFQAFFLIVMPLSLAGHHRHLDLLLHRRLERVRLCRHLPQQGRAR